LPVHEVKIDRSFVQGLESDPEFAPVVRAAIDMGHGLGLQVSPKASRPTRRRLACAISAAISHRATCTRNHAARGVETWLEGRVRVPVIAVPVDFKTEDLADTVSLGVY